MSTPTRHLKWLGANVSKREAERSRLEREVERTEYLVKNYHSHVYEAEYMAAVAALERFEDGEA